MSFTCFDLNGGKMCVSAQLFNGNPSFAGANGSPCAVGNDCRSNFCPSSSCVDSCSEDTDCGATKCQWFNFTTDQWLASCMGSAGTGANGATCAADSDCRSGVCYGNGTCGDLCGTSAHCPSNNICVFVDYSVCQLDVGTCSAWQPNYVKACVNPGSPVGASAVGAACTQGASCRSGLCDTTAGQCTDTCSRDAHCPSGFVCGVGLWDTLSDGTQIWANLCKARGSNN
jgi:hypothetical protein